MKEEFLRTAMLITPEKIDILKNSHIGIFGIGGVGGYIAESLARAGVGHLTLIDKDRVSFSNINRQIIALHSTVGRAKVEVMKERAMDINPDIKVDTFEEFYLPENADSFELGGFDYIADAVDTVTAKLELIKRAKEKKIPIISACGAGGKLCPQEFEVADIFQTKGCPLARIMRKELKARGIKDLKVVYSPEEPKGERLIDELSGKPISGSISFTPSAMGLIMAGEIIKDLIK